MFKKLISNLPFNPSLIGQVSFYARRLHKEERLRRLGFMMLAVAFFMQLFAVVSPPQLSLAADPNDIIWGGVDSTAKLINAYNTNAHGDVQRIFNQFGVGPDQLNQARDSSVDTRGANNYYSIGRTLADRTDSFQISITGGASTDIYMRSLGGWAQKVWGAYEVPSTKYGKVWILKDCGNIVTDGIPPMGPPALEIKKFAEPSHGSDVFPGDRIHYTLVFSNKGSGPAQNFYVEDHIPDAVENIQIGESGAFEYVNGHTFSAYWDELPKPSVLGNHPTQEYQVNFWVTVRDVYPGTFCNQGQASAVDASAFSNGVCHTIPACPYNPALHSRHPSCQPPPPPPVETPPTETPPPPPPVATCTALNARFLSRTQVEFEALATATDGATISAFEFDTGTGVKETVPASASSGNVSAKYTYEYPGSPAPAIYSARVTAVTSLGNLSSDTCSRPIEIEKEKLAIVTVEKTTGTTSQEQGSRIKVDPGEEFSFNFTIKNLGDAPAENYELPKDNITDILEYADLASAGDAKLTKESNEASFLNWDPVTVQPGETLVKTVTFKLKSELPKTNTPPSNPKSFDCQIENTINSSTTIIDIDKSHCIAKVIEKTTTTLPKTGPGQSLILSFFVTFVVSYFFARSRLLVKEVELVRSEYVSNGSY